VAHQLVEVMGADALTAEAQAQFLQVDEADIGFLVIRPGRGRATDKQMLAVETAVLQAVMMQARTGQGHRPDQRAPQQGVAAVGRGLPFVKAERVIERARDENRTPLSGGKPVAIIERLDGADRVLLQAPDVQVLAIEGRDTA
jgi:hypothetical protein